MHGYLLHRVQRALVALALISVPGVVFTQSPAPTPAAAVKPGDTIPLDTAIQTGTLPNGLKYFVRQNALPAKRVSLRLAVKSASMEEADDQQGLAHFIEHMAFNG